MTEPPKKVFDALDFVIWMRDRGLIIIDPVWKNTVVLEIEAFTAQRVAEALEQHIRDQYSLKKSDEAENERILIKREDFFEAIDKHNEEVIARRARKKVAQPRK